MEAYKMKVDYNKLFEKIKAEGMTQAVFKKNANINSSTLNKLLHNGNVTTEIICRICDYFQCLPEEIMEWIPDADYEDKQKAKAEVQAQIDELQEQLKKLQMRNGQYSKNILSGRIIKGKRKSAPNKGKLLGAIFIPQN